MTTLHPKNITTLDPGWHHDDAKDGVKGLMLRVRDNGVRSWVVRYGAEGHVETLAPADGRKGTLSLGGARKAAEKRLGAIVAVGPAKFREKVETERDETRQKKAEEKAEKRAGLFGKFVEKEIKKATIRESTRRGWDSILRASIAPTLGKFKLKAIDKAKVSEALTVIQARSVWAADSAHKLLTWVFKIAAQRDLILRSPMDGLRRADFRVKDGGRRKVVPTGDQLRAIWNATEEHGLHGKAAKLGLLTLARREEIYGAKLDEFHLDEDATKSVWKIPAARTKSDEDHSVPLTAEAVAIVRELQADAEAQGTEYLLPGVSGALMPTSKAWSALMATAGIVRKEPKGQKRQATKETGEKTRRPWRAHPLRFHDLRRAGRSIMETELEIPASVAEAVIGHSAPALVRAYSPKGPGLPERRKAITRWTNHLMTVVTGGSDRKVLTGTFGKE